MAAYCLLPLMMSFYEFCDRVMLCMCKCMCKCRCKCKSWSQSYLSILALCWSRSMCLEVVTYCESRVGLTPEVVRTCRYYVYMYEDSHDEPHQRLLGHAGINITATYCLLPFMMSFHEFCDRIMLCKCMCSCMYWWQVHVPMQVFIVRLLQHTFRRFICDYYCGYCLFLSTMGFLR